MPAIRLLATGGTIASRREGAAYRASASGADLVARAAVPDGCTISVTDAGTVGSFAWQWADVTGLLRLIAESLREDVDGIVVTHGTDTMEEVAFLAGLVHDDPRPVVFTGAQRPFDHPGADGPANLSDAVGVAASPAARGRGVLLAFDGLVFGAHGVTKVDTSRSGAFDAPGRGPQLRVAWGRVVPLVPARRPRILPSDLAFPRVDVVPLYVGVDAVLLRAAVDAGARGIVLSAFGAGNANPTVVEAVQEVVDAGLPVLLCSRVAAGPVHPVYRGGGGADLADAGVIFGADLSPWQGRMLLAAALASDRDNPRPVIERWLDDPLEES